MITDIHFGARNDSPLFLENLTHFFETSFFPAIDKNNITDVLILGDTWQNRRNINIHTLHIAKEKFFDVLQSRGIAVKIVYGNHDVFYKNTNEINSIDFLSEQYPNIEVVDTFKVFTFDNVKIGMMSWIPNEGSEKYMEFIKTAECDILCGHYEINSFEMVAGHYCSGGLSKDIFQRYEKVISGHFHIPSSDGRIVYLGNPLQTNWGDWGIEKGAWILNTDTLYLDRILNTNTVFEKIHYTEDVDILSFPYKSYAGKIVRLFVDNFLIVEKNKFELFVDRLSEVVHELEVHEVDHSVLAPTDLKSASDCVNTADTISLYASSISFPESIDRGRFLSIMLDVYKESSERVIV